MAHGVPEVECLANTLFGGVLLHDALLHLHRLRNQRKERVSGDILEVEIKDFVERVAVAEQCVFHHLAIARFEFGERQSVEEAGGNEHRVSLVKHPDFVLVAVEIDSGLATHGSIDSRQQSCGDVDKPHSALESRGGKTAHVGNHAATNVEHHRVASGATLLQAAPHLGERVDILVHIATLRDDFHSRGNVGVVGDARHHKAVDIHIGDNKQSVVVAIGENLVESSVEIVGEYKFLIHKFEGLRMDKISGRSA